MQNQTSTQVMYPSDIWALRLYLPYVFVKMVEDFLQRLMSIFEASSQESLKGGSEKIEGIFYQWKCGWTKSCTLKIYAQTLLHLKTIWHSATNAKAVLILDMDSNGFDF